MTITFDDDKQNKNLDDLLYREEEELVKTLAQAKYGVPPIDLANISIENDAIRTITESDARKEEVGPFKILGRDVHIGVRHPSKDHLTNLQEYFSMHNLIPHFYMVSLASLEKVWSHYKELSYASEAKSGNIAISSDDLKILIKNINSVDDIKKSIEEIEKNQSHTTSHILEILLAGAIAIDASDIHFEPEEGTIIVRFRLDGVLKEVIQIPPYVHKFINSRIKILSSLKLTSQSTAQDGRFSIFIDDQEINIRVSVLPGAYGESIVMRILNPKSIQTELDQMDIEKNLYELFLREIKKPNGLILLTGPTGSGKTTTLYSFLQKIYSTETKIITIEDPIEYHLNGITQTQTNDEKGYTFVEGLHSALRQDPDVIMVGEIRDKETAEIAVQSALTGHLVFSTLHTNNAAGVIPRLIDLGVNPKILVSALSLSIAQRLVRRLCNDCKKEKEANEEETKIIKKVYDDAEKYGKKLENYGVAFNSPYKIYSSVGCILCNNTGYKGRIGIFEAICTNKEIEDIINTNPSERDVIKASKSQGYLNMLEDGIVKVLKGITSFEETASVVDFYEE